LNEIKPKPIVQAGHAISWHIGNYVMNPNNALRENEALLDAKGTCVIPKSNAYGLRL